MVKLAVKIRYFIEADGPEQRREICCTYTRVEILKASAEELGEIANFRIRFRAAFGSGPFP